MVAVTITNEQKIPITLNPKTAANNPASIEAGSLKFEILEGDGSAEADPDNPNRFYAISGIATGAITRIKVSADGDLGEGVSTIEDEVLLTVTPATASSLGLVIGEPELK